MIKQCAGRRRNQFYFWDEYAKDLINVNLKYLHLNLHYDALLATAEKKTVYSAVANTVSSKWGKDT